MRGLYRDVRSLEMTQDQYEEEFGYVGTEIFFTDGEWELHGNPLRHTTLNPSVSRVVHYCTEPRNDKSAESCHVWARLNGSLNCPKCGVLMPDSVQTLWTLQNFDVDFGPSEPYSGLNPHLVTG